MRPSLFVCTAAVLLHVHLTTVDAWNQAGKTAGVASTRRAPGAGVAPSSSQQSVAFPVSGSATSPTFSLTAIENGEVGMIITPPSGSQTVFADVNVVVGDKAQAQNAGGVWRLDLDRGGDGTVDEVIHPVNTGPTAATVTRFGATRVGHSVRLRWQVAAEAQTLGFNLYREQRGKLVKLNRALIPSVFAGAASGHAYSFLDRNARRGATHTYRLQAVSLDGTRAWLGTAVARR